MDGTLQDLAGLIRTSRGFEGKRDIAGAVEALGLASGGRLGAAGEAIAVGDDCAALRDGDGFLLFAIEGFIDSFVAADPWFAGYCGIMVNLSDIAAMGGRPIAVVDALWAVDEAGGRARVGGVEGRGRDLRRTGRRRPHQYALGPRRSRGRDPRPGQMPADEFRRPARA